MGIIRRLKDKVLSMYKIDRKAERLIYKSIEVFHRGGTFNHWYAMHLAAKVNRKYRARIYPGISLGKGTYIAHANEIIIGPTSVIGNNCKLYPGCSFVAGVLDDEERGANGKRRHPLVGDNCIIGNSSRLIGDITIGHNVIIGAGAVVRQNVPSYAIVVGNPAKIIGFTMTPEEAYQNELKNYPESERISKEQLDKNYKKYFISRIKEIKTFSRL